MTLNKAVEAARGGFCFLEQLLREWDIAHAEARRYGSMEHVTAFNKACDDGARIQNDITKHFGYKTITEARNALSTLPAKPMSEDEIKGILKKAIQSSVFNDEKKEYYERHLPETIFLALREEGVLYVEEK